LCCLFFFDIRILIISLWYLQTLHSIIHSVLFRKCSEEHGLNVKIYKSILFYIAFLPGPG
jgi:hypothetical protein